MFTAILVGSVLAFSSIFIYSFFINSKPATAQISLPQLNEEDPATTSRLSNLIIYSADQNLEIIESAKNSLPRVASNKVSALGYMVMNMDDDFLILQKNPETLMPIASVTKLVTAVMIRKLFDQEKYITITNEILRTYGNEGRLRQGEKFRVSELLYPLLLVSSNDSAEALAQSYPQGRQKFIKEMNNWVNSIGAYRTYFKDPSGLSASNVSTAKDLGIITKWILENDPEIFEITLNKLKTIRTHTWINPTHFLNLSTYAGGKNGYTPEANRTNISLFKLGRQKKIFAVVLLGSSLRDNDTLDLLEEAVK
jgi:D-alanyl-D-alanine endopeptidase (penicillin-binding protein 7)